MAHALLLASLLLLARLGAAQTEGPIGGTSTVRLGTLEEGTTTTDELVIHPTVEVDWVRGCSDSVPRRATARCSANAAITIRGRHFGRHSARVQLIPRRQIGKDGAAAVDAVDCDNVRHSGTLPSLLLFCTLPAAAPASEWHVRVVVRNGITGLLRHAVTYKPDAADSAGSGASASAEPDVLRALDFSDWKELGVGGLGKQFKALFRRAFGSRLSAVAPIARKMNIRHVKGVIFHGLPGTGKTLVARKVADVLGAKHVRVVNGPEIMSKFVGESEKNLRDLFGDAEASWAKEGVNAPLHVIIIDEIDAIMRQRGAGEESAARAVYDGVTTQMLSYMDGIKGGNNLLIIGLTNRLDALDTALLRPGRFEVQIRFPLPDAAGRKEIFTIHTEALHSNKFLADTVDVDGLVDETAAFSGADIAGVVRSATSYALARVYERKAAEAGDDTAAADAAPELTFRVTNDDFIRGIKETLEAKSATANTQPYLRNGYVLYDDRIVRLLQRMQRRAKAVQNAPSVSALRVLIEGPAESGLTATAAVVARRAQFPFVHIVSPDAFVGLSSSEKIDRLRNIFDTAAQSPAACVILDSIEHLIEFNSVQSRVNANIQFELASLLRRRTQPKSLADPSLDDSKAVGPEGDGRLFVIATTSNADAVRVLSSGMQLFDAVESLSLLSRSDAATVMEAYGIDGERDALRALAARLPPELPLKRLLLWIDTARGSTPASRTAHTGDLRPFPGAATLELLGSSDGLADGSAKKPNVRIAVDEFETVLSDFGVIEPATSTSTSAERADKAQDFTHW